MLHLSQRSGTQVSSPGLGGSGAEDGVARAHEDVEQPDRRDHRRPADAREERPSVEERDRIEAEARQDEDVQVEQPKRPSRVDEREDEEDGEDEVRAQLE